MPHFLKPISLPLLASSSRSPTLRMRDKGRASVYSRTDVETKLYVQRIGWKSKIDLTELNSVQVDPTAMSKSIRLFGNGGLFCFAGIFRNHKLGRYWAFATSPKKSVILRFPKRTIVVTPEDPDRFAEMVHAQL